MLGSPLVAKTKKASAPHAQTQSKSEAITPVTITKDGYTFQYPSNWTRNDEEKSPSDPINTIILDCPKNSYLKFLILDGFKLDVDQRLKDILQSYVTAITTYSKKDIRRWGPFYGKGVQIEGKVMNAFPGGIRIFVSESIDGKHFIITEYYYAEDIESYQGGVEMIQNSLKKAPKK